MIVEEKGTYSIEQSKLDDQNMKFLVINRYPDRVSSAQREMIEKELFKVFSKYEK